MADTVDPRVVRTRQDVLQATLDVLVDEGWDAVTHPHVARVAGYSKATLYAHWPDRLALVRDAFAHWGAIPHLAPVGTLREDLRIELQSFRSSLSDHRLDRALAVLAERTPAVPELRPVRDAFLADGERPLRKRLEPLLDPLEVDVAVHMLCGGMLHAVVMHGRVPADDFIDTAVEAVLTAFDLDPAA